MNGGTHAIRHGPGTRRAREAARGYFRYGASTDICGLSTPFDGSIEYM
ncbi:hypothetical protein GO285_04491 [Ralstonia solanacearum]|nr:hypothetical protein [Ralstonia solanacearum]NKA05917.1 hypothetical protein [Ralstonia solanacearum]NKA10544.1 hypothetical protein [Ralstonia solanacearum]NKA15776.1 hypothetical protein [Ralstonia solanacearum]NKA50767.1 hypothetical protein [Ralstonia solanacearum]